MNLSGQRRGCREPPFLLENIEVLKGALAEPELVGKPLEETVGKIVTLGLQRPVEIVADFRFAVGVTRCLEDEFGGCPRVDLGLAVDQRIAGGP